MMQTINQFTVKSFILVAFFASASEIYSQTEMDSDYFAPTVLFDVLPGNIRGRVIDENWTPVAGAEVFATDANVGEPFGLAESRELYKANQVPLRQAIKFTTDSQGRFEFSGDVLAGHYVRLFVRHKDFSSVLVEELYDGITIQLKKGNLADGTIVDEKGDPIENVLVRIASKTSIFDIGSKDLRYKTQTNSSGEFQIPHVANRKNESVHIVLSKDGYLPKSIFWFPDKIAMSHAGQASETDNVKTGRFQTALRRSAYVKIRGRNSQQDQVAIQAAAVRYTTSDAEKADLYGYLRSKNPEINDGVASFNLLPLNEQTTLSVYPEPSSGLLGQRFKKDLSQPGNYQLDVQFEPGVKVSGKLVDHENGIPVANVPIAFYPESGVEQLNEGLLFNRFVRTNSEGEFVIVVPPGDSVLRMVGDVPGYQTIDTEAQPPFPAKIAAQFQRTVSGKAGQTIEDVDFFLKPARKITFSVVDSSGSPISGLLVFSSHLNHPRQRYGKNLGLTNQHGIFETETLLDDPLSNYNQNNANKILFVDRHSLKEKMLVLDEFDRDGLDKTIVVEFDAVDLDSVSHSETELVDGQIIDSHSGQPIAGASIKTHFYTQENFVRLGAMTTSNVEGKFRLPRNVVQNPNSKLTIAKEGYHSKRLPVWEVVPRHEGAVFERKSNLTTIKINPVQHVEVTVPDLSIDGLSKTEACKKIIDFLESQRLRLDSEAEKKLIPGYAKRFVWTLYYRSGDAIKELQKSDLPPDLESKVYLTLLKVAFSGDSYVPPWTGDRWYNEMHIRLQSNLVDQPGVFDWLKTRSYYGFANGIEKNVFYNKAPC